MSTFDKMRTNKLMMLLSCVLMIAPMSSAYEYASIRSVPASATKRASWAPTYLNEYAEPLDRGTYSPSVDDLFYNPIRFKRAMKNAVRSWQLQRPSGPLNLPE